MKAINSFRGKYYFLSNMYPVNIKVGDYTFTCVESAFQAMKCKNIEDIYSFIGLDGYTAKRLGRKVKLRKDWNEVKLSIMKELVRRKFTDKHLKQLLINTNDYELIEGNTWGDTYWGVCNGNGENHLGKILMETREEIKKESDIT